MTDKPFSCYLMEFLSTIIRIKGTMNISPPVPRIPCACQSCTPTTSFHAHGNGPLYQSWITYPLDTPTMDLLSHRDANLHLDFAWGYICCRPNSSICPLICPNLQYQLQPALFTIKMSSWHGIFHFLKKKKDIK